MAVSAQWGLLMLIYFAGGARNVAAATAAMLNFHILAVNMDLLE